MTMKRSSATSGFIDIHSDVAGAEMSVEYISAPKPHGDDDEGQTDEIGD
jgi:hypothetical protein